VSLWRGEKVQAFLAEFADAWLSKAALAGGLSRVMLVFLLQSKIVLCVAAISGGLKPQSEAFMRA
jgi:hypothetical protein